VALPGLTLGEALQPTPFIDRYAPGDKVVYDYLTVTFIVDEDLKAWLEIHDWIRGMGFPEKYEEYLLLGKFPPINSSEVSKTPQYSDAVLTLLNSKMNKTLRFKFKDCFPTSLSALVFTTQEGPETPLTADVTFRFLIYNIDR
jgi:hypothetical protein